MSVFTSRQIPTWARSLGKYGLFVFSGYLVVRFLIEAVFESEIQSWWATYAKPWLTSKEVVQVDLFVWQILLIGFVFVLIIGTLPFLIRKISIRNPNPLEQFRHGQVPEHIQDTSLSTSDIVSAVVSTRKGIMSPDDLANLVISALNSSLINKETATRTLNEFGYSLVYLGGDKYTFSKSRGSDE